MIADAMCVVIGDRVWGKGVDLQAAINRAKLELGSRAKTEFIGYAVVAKCPMLDPTESADLSEDDPVPTDRSHVWIDGMGGLNWVRCDVYRLGKFKA